jgi:DGQHR domain-containing protein
MYSAVLHPSALERFSIDMWNPRSAASRRGYQRKLDENRIKQIKKYFERRDAIMPVAGLVNVREKGSLKYRNGRLTIPDGTEVWVVDMQHRLKGLIQAREEGIIRNDFDFPVVITEGLTQTEEAVQFYIINTKAKRMDVALTRRLLIERGMVRDIADVKPWEIKAVQATIALNNAIRNNPWYGAIRQPNEEKLTSHIATEKSFVSSLRQLFIGSWKTKRPMRAATEIADMWNGIREAIPEAFKEPRKSLIQKTHGMFAFNFFVAPVLLTKHKGNLRNKLLRLRDLGHSFWNSKNKHGARRFGTGMGGYSNLAEYVKQHLEL